MARYSKYIYASQPFKFIVEGEQFFVHKELIALYSKPLDRMMNGHMAEAVGGFATLHDVDEDTFARFIQWMYEKDYTAAKAKKTAQRESTLRVIPKAAELSASNVDNHGEGRSSDPQPSNTTQPAFTPRNGAEGRAGFHPNTTQSKFSRREENIQRRATTRGALRESFLRRGGGFSLQNQALSDQNLDPHDDFTDVFISHARVYVFAEMYDIVGLKDYALNRLRFALASFHVFPERTGDVLNLLRYIYGNIEERNVQELRDLLMEYMAYAMDSFMNDKGFRNLLIEEGGLLLDDFMDTLTERI